MSPASRDGEAGVRAGRPEPRRAAAEPQRRRSTRRGDVAARDKRSRQFVLRLYVTGASRASRHAIERIRALCEEKLSGRYELEVIDIYQLPALAKDEQIIATPTLIRVLPAPLRRFIGDLSKAEKVFFGLDVREKP